MKNVSKYNLSGESEDYYYENFILKKRVKATDNGRLFAIDGRSGKWHEVFGTLAPNGYLRFSIKANGKSMIFLKHRILSILYFGLPKDNNNIVNHKNENKTDNRKDNLEWCNHSYNTNYITGIQRAKNKISKPILRFDKNNIFIAEYKSINEVKKLGFSPGNICSCCKGNIKTAYNCIWKYKENPELI